MLRKIRLVQWLFLFLALGAAGFGFWLQQRAFPSSTSSPFAQVSATVYTELNPSRVLLKAKIEPNASQDDRLEIAVKGPRSKPDPWLLVVTCRHPVDPVAMQLIGVTHPQPTYVLASVHDRSYQSVPLGCFSAPSGQHGPATHVALTGQDINLSLPVLEQSPLGQSATAGTPLYVVRRASAGHAIEKLVEVFQAPESTCPGPVLSPAPPASSSATVTSTPASTGGRDVPPTSPPAGGPAGAQSTNCYTQLPAGAIATKYSIPASVTTSEILENVSLSGDRIDSMFPPGQITSHDTIIWQGASSLSPDLSATTLTGEENANRDGFFAGLCYGLAAGLIVPFLQGLTDAYDSARRDRGKVKEEAAGRASDARETGDGSSGQGQGLTFR